LTQTLQAADIVNANKPRRDYNVYKYTRILEDSTSGIGGTCRHIVCGGATGIVRPAHGEYRGQVCEREHSLEAGFNFRAYKKVRPAHGEYRGSVCDAFAFSRSRVQFPGIQKGAPGVYALSLRA